MADTLYVNKPGGVIAHLDDGTAELLQYGQTVPPNLASHVDASTFADDQPRLGATDLALEQAREAHRRTAVEAENGQVNSGQSPVPGNYSDLDEDGAALLVLNLARYPEQQAAVIYHEILYGGNRQKVVDAGGNYAQLSAKARIAGLLEAQKADEYGGSRAARGVSSPGDPSIQAGDEAATARFQVKADDTLQADVVAAGVPAPTSIPVDQPWPPRETVADSTAVIHEQGTKPEDSALARDVPPASLTSPMPTADAALKAREDAVAQQEQALAERESAIQQERDRLEQLLADRRGSAESVDGGEAGDFDGDGVGSEGYWSKADLEKYAEQHDVEGFPKSGSRDEQLKALKDAGHDKPETPKP